MDPRRSPQSIDDTSFRGAIVGFGSVTGIVNVKDDIAHMELVKQCHNGVMKH